MLGQVWKTGLFQKNILILIRQVHQRSTSGYCTFLGGNLVTWRSKKQSVVAWSSADAEFRAMARGIFELLWLKIILDDLGIRWKGTMKLYCDKKSAINIAHNPVQHNCTKHVKVDQHFIKEKLECGLNMHILCINRRTTCRYTNQRSCKLLISSNYKQAWK